MFGRLGRRCPGTGLVMAAGGFFNEIARKYCAYTGESLQQVKHGIAIDRDAPIPAAVGEQALLESAVFRVLLRRHEWFAHPNGISRVRMNSGDAPIVCLDSHFAGYRGREVASSQTVVEGALPWIDSTGEVHGVVGLRVIDCDGPDLLVRLAGTESRLVLRAVPHTRWESVIAAWHDGFAGSDDAPVWHEPAMTRAERRQDYLLGIDKALAWIGSGLLRRAALFHTMTSAYSTTMWTTGKVWMVEMDTRSDVAHDHQSFISCLLDPAWGLPVRLSDQWCECGTAPDPDNDRCCMVELEHTGLEQGSVRLRFRHIHHSFDSGRRRELLRAGADWQWLDRVLPEPAGAAAYRRGRRKGAIDEAQQ